MPIAATYVHTNVVAKDWQRLADFYQNVFGCTPVPPTRDYSGPLFDALTGLPNSRQCGVHLRLPGCGEDGPTLEVFQYDPALEKPEIKLNRMGFGHIAFAVEDVAAALQAVIAAGGHAVGETVTLTRSDGKQVTVVYATDPEDNVLELQHWF